MSGTQFKRKKQHKKPLALSYFGIGMVGETRDAHHGTLLRSSYQYGASFICKIGGKHTKHTMRDTDTTKAWCYIPVFSYPSVEKLANCAPYSCPWVACVDAPGGTPLKDFKHPPRALYLFPGDDKGLLKSMLTKCKYHVMPPRSQHYSGTDLTTSPIFGTMVLYDRYMKENANKLGQPDRFENANKKRRVADSVQTTGAKISSIAEAGKIEVIDQWKEGEDNYYDFENVLHLKKDSGKLLRYLEKNEDNCCLAISTTHAYKNRLVVYMRLVHRLNVVAHSNELCIFSFKIPNQQGDSDREQKKKNLTALGKLCQDSVPLRGIDYCGVIQKVSNGFEDIRKLVLDHNKAQGERTCVYRIQTRPNSLAGKIIPLLPEEIMLNPKDFTHVIYVAAHDFGSFEGKDSILKYFLGIVDRKHNYSTSIGSSSGLSFFRQPKISRAYYKLYELDKRGLVDFRGETESSRAPLAIDIGASPGGWTEFLVEKNNRTVLAIDPGTMDTELLKNSKVIHVNKKIEDSLSIIDSYARNTSNFFLDMIVCDMNMDPRDSARVCNKVFKYLGKNGILILTIKLVLRGKTMYKSLMLDTVKMLVGAGYKVDKTVWLFANGRHERTLIAHKD